MTSEPVKLDPERQKRAAARARAAEAAAKHHEASAAAVRIKLASICHTWSLDPVTFEPIE